MKNLCILAKEKISLPLTKEVNVLFAEFDTLNIPWYIYDDSTMKMTVKSNCDNESIQNAKEHTLIVKAHKTCYALVLRWWAGHQVYGSYSTYSEAARHLATRSRTYQGNGCFVIEEQKMMKEIEVTESVLAQIISDYDGQHNKITLAWK